MAKQCGGRDVGALRGVRPVAGARRLGGLVDGLWGALLPVQCAGCLAWDEVLCPSCRSLAAAPALPTAVDGARGPIPGVVLGDYSGPLRRIVLTAKHAARTDVSDFLDEAGAALGTSLREGVRSREGGDRVGCARAFVVAQAPAGAFGGVAAGARGCAGVGIGRSGCARVRGGRVGLARGGGVTVGQGGGGACRGAHGVDAPAG